VVNREPGRRASRFDAQLRVNRSQVGVHRPGTHAEAFGDLPIHQAGGDQFEDLHLSGGETIDAAGSRHREPFAAG